MDLVPSTNHMLNSIGRLPNCSSEHFLKFYYKKATDSYFNKLVLNIQLP